MMERTALLARDLSPATRRRAARALLAAAVLALVWSAAWFYAPPLIRSQAEKAASEALGRRVSIGAVSFNPWTLEANVTDLVVAGRDGTPPQLVIGRLRADIALVSLFRLAPVVDRLEIDAPRMRVERRADGRLDIDDVVQRLITRAAGPGDEPAHFALHNIVVTRGSADVADATIGAKHVLRDLELAVPFISSLPSQRDVKVEPRLAFVLDGSRFDSSAAAAPFSASGAGEATLRLAGLDVSPWLAYLPKSAPLRLTTAVLGADLRLAFEQRPKLSLRVSGSVDVSRIAVVDAGAGALLDVGSVKVVIDELRPLERLARLRRIEVDAPHVLAVRNEAGKVNLMLEGVAPSGVATAVATLPVPTSAASAASATKAAAPAPQWKVVLNELAVRAGSLDWRDAGVTPAAALALNDVSFTATALQWPLDAPVIFKGEGTLVGASGRGRLAVSGQGNAAGARVQVGVDAVPLSLAASYLRAFVTPSLAGTLDADVRVEWLPGGDAPRLDIQAKRVALDALRLGDAKAPELAADRIEIASARIDWAARSVAIGRLELQAPRVRVERDRERRWNFARWPAAPPTGAAASDIKPAGWTVAVDELVLDKGRVGFADRALAVPVALDVSELAVQLRNFALDSATPAPFSVRARIAVPAGPTGVAVGSGFAGSVEARGELARFAAGVPAVAKAALTLKNLPLHLLDPYLDELLQVDVQKAQTSFTGDVAYESLADGPRLRVNGDAVIDDFRADGSLADRGAPQRALAMESEGPAGRQLLSWKTLTLRGIELAMDPGAATRLVVAETTASDLFARIVLDEAGRINLQDVARPAPAPAAAAASAPAASAAPAPVIRFGPIGIVNARVAFNDRFVKPNYSANLSELNGSLGSFSSVGAGVGEAPLLADLELRGRVEGTASLEITGKLNPLARPLALDIAAKVRDLELPPLSPYAIKYAGYGIERGKMSVDVSYLVKPDGQLTAQNKIVLNQLAFGDKVGGAPASLPVKLAVALLANRNGVIDLDLPVGGSINDPQFSIGGLIWKALGNLIVKAVTSPFSLLASALGGGGSSELSQVAFAPGSSTLDAAAKESLDKVAKALLERPALTLTVNGESRLDSEREAWKAERLGELVRAEKRRQAIAGGASPTAEVTLAEADYPVLLKEVYRRADIVKPKNALGVAKELPPAEMEPLLLASITVPDDAMQQLAVRRAVVVRDYLATKELPTSRLFLGAPKTGGGGAQAAAWAPRAELTLAMN